MRATVVGLIVLFCRKIELDIGKMIALKIIFENNWISLKKNYFFMVSFSLQVSVNNTVLVFSEENISASNHKHRSPYRVDTHCTSNNKSSHNSPSHRYPEFVSDFWLLLELLVIPNTDRKNSPPYKVFSVRTQSVSLRGRSVRSGSTSSLSSINPNFQNRRTVRIRSRLGRAGLMCWCEETV